VPDVKDKKIIAGDAVENKIGIVEHRPYDVLHRQPIDRFLERNSTYRSKI